MEKSMVVKGGNGPGITLTQQQVSEIADISLKLIYRAEILSGLSVVLHDMAESEFKGYTEPWKKLIGMHAQLQEMADDISNYTDRLDNITDRLEGQEETAKEVDHAEKN